jgi:hypothetical protein
MRNRDGKTKGRSHPRPSFSVTRPRVRRAGWPTTLGRVDVAEEFPCLEDLAYAEALAPFSREEQLRLVRYTVRADRLARCSFWEREQKMTVTGGEGQGQPLTVEMPHAEDPFDEAIDAMFQRLRIFYQPGRKSAASFERIIDMLREHASVNSSAESEKFLGLLDECTQVHEKAASTSPGIELTIEIANSAGIQVSSTTDPREAFEDWLYGEYLHDDEVRLARIEQWRHLGGHLFVALAVARNLGRFYVSFSNNVVERVSAEPTLFPPPRRMPSSWQTERRSYCDAPFVVGE